MTSTAVPSVDGPLERALAQAPPRVVAAWLYGSRARGTGRAGSDVDVAVLLSTSPVGFDPLVHELEHTLAMALLASGVVAPRPEGLVQVVAMNGAPADLGRRVLRDGKLLLERDRSARVAFEVALRNRYWDMAPIWRQYRRLPPEATP